METKDEPSSCLSTSLIWISGRRSLLSIRNQSRGLWNISNPNLAIWISMARAVECIMIIALNYMSYLHVCLLCVQHGVDLSPVDPPVAPCLPLRPQKVVWRALATARDQLIIASTSEWRTTFIYHLTDRWPHCHWANVSLVFRRDQSRKPPRNLYAEDAGPINARSERGRRGALRPALKMATEQVTNGAPSLHRSQHRVPSCRMCEGQRLIWPCLRLLIILRTRDGPHRLTKMESPRVKEGTGHSKKPHISF